MTRKTILIVETVVEHASQVAEYLESDGFSVLTAVNALDAGEIVSSRKVDLAVLDIRLKDEEDPGDVSGLSLARELPDWLPKIIWTAYPSWELVREALAVRTGDKPLAVGFVAKEEGTGRLAARIKFILSDASSLVQNQLVKAFGASGPSELVRVMTEIEPGESTRRFKRGVEEAAQILKGVAEQEVRQARNHHLAGLTASGIGIALMISVIVLAGLGELSDGVGVILALCVIVQGIGVLFFRREDAAHRRVVAYLQDLSNIDRIDGAFELTGVAEFSTDQDAFMRNLLDRLLDIIVIRAKSNLGGSESGVPAEERKESEGLRE